MRAKTHPKFIKNTLIKRFDFKLHFCCDILRFFQFLSILMPRTCVSDLDQHGTERARYELQNVAKPLLLFCFGCASRYAACLYSFTFCFPSLFFCFAYSCFVSFRLVSFLFISFCLFVVSHVFCVISLSVCFFSFRFVSLLLVVFCSVLFLFAYRCFFSLRQKKYHNEAKTEPK